MFAAEGAKVVVNDLGSDVHGSGVDRSAAEAVVAEIRAVGGEAVANTDDVSDWDGAKRLVDQAVDVFGELHVLVNNAGILRDRMIVNMTEDDWDAVIRVHVRGHFLPTRHAASYWREQHKAGRHLNPSLIHTTSTSGFYANRGQANYASAKSAIATLSQVAAKELASYGVRSNAVAPGARTRLTGATPELAAVMKESKAGPRDTWAAENVSPFVAYLATEGCQFNGETFIVVGGLVQRVTSWSAAEAIQNEGRWEVDELAQQADQLLAHPETRPRPPLVGRP